MAPIKESQIEAAILDYLNSLKDGFFWKNPSSGFFDGKVMRKHSSKYAINGASDVIGVFRGRFCAFEVKTPKEYQYYLNHGERLRAAPFIYCRTKKDERFWKQISFIEMIKRKGGLGDIVASIDHVKRILQEA